MQRIVSIIYYMREGLSTLVYLTLLYWFADFSSNLDSSRISMGVGGGAQRQKRRLRAAHERVAKPTIVV
jgi:hypothetical protein